MSLKLRYFTLEEANSLLPKITELLKAAQETKALIEKKVDDWRKVHKSLKEADEAIVRGQVDYLASTLEAQLGEISELGCFPKDLDLGLVDFAARIDGKEGYFCWKLEEEKIGHWHGLTEGYKRRRPLKAKTI